MNRRRFDTITGRNLCLGHHCRCVKVVFGFERKGKEGREEQRKEKESKRYNGFQNATIIYARASTRDGQITNSSISAHDIPIFILHDLSVINFLSVNKFF